MNLANHLRTIGAHDHTLTMRDLKPLSGLGRDDRDLFWQEWGSVSAQRRSDIVRSMVTLAEDNIDLDFGAVFRWCLDDEEPAVRTASVEGLWEDDTSWVFQRICTLLQSDPAPAVRATAAMALSRFAYLAE